MENLHFDAWQFANNQVYAVSPSTRISFSDYERMGTYSHKASGQRRYPTPLYALNDKILRQLLLVFMEVRLYIRGSQGSDTERRERIRQAALEQQPRLAATVDKLNREYVEAQADHAPPERLKNLEMEIEMLDTQLRTCREGGMGLVASICYLYHRLRLDSVGVAAELGIKPPHVRSILWKLNEVFKSKFNEDGSLKPSDRPIAWDVNLAFLWRLSGLTYAQAAEKLGVATSTLAGFFQAKGIVVPKFRPGKPVKPPRVVALREKKPKVVRIPKPKPPRRERFRVDVGKAAELRKAGMFWKDIAKVLGARNADVVYCAVKRAGLWVPFWQKKKAGTLRPRPDHLCSNHCMCRHNQTVATRTANPNTANHVCA